tara:strand:+ start:325 stop:474 length:150 start_codon:yes stop_codon:yes gene_type:complete
MEKSKKGDIRKKFAVKWRDLELIILQSEIRQFGTWLYGKKHREEEEESF